MPLPWPVQAFPQTWSTGGEGGPGSGRSHWAELATPPAWLPSCSLPGSRVSTGMTLLIPADPVPQLLIGPIVCVGVCVHEHTHVHTSADTRERTPSLKPPLTLTSQLHLPLATYLCSFFPVTGLTYMPKQKTLMCQVALAGPRPLGGLPVHLPRLATILWPDAAPSLPRRRPSGTTDNQR